MRDSNNSYCHDIFKAFVILVFGGMEWTFSFGVLDFASEDEADAFESKVTSRCLKASGHNPAENVTYETPSDYDPLAVNMGALTVYR